MDSFLNPTQLTYTAYTRTISHLILALHLSFDISFSLYISPTAPFALSTHILPYFSFSTAVVLSSSSGTSRLWFYLQQQFSQLEPPLHLFTISFGVVSIFVHISLSIMFRSKKSKWNPSSFEDYVQF